MAHQSASLIVRIVTVGPKEEEMEAPFPDATLQSRPSCV